MTTPDDREILKALMLEHLRAKHGTWRFAAYDAADDILESDWFAAQLDAARATGRAEGWDKCAAARAAWGYITTSPYRAGLDVSPQPEPEPRPRYYQPQPEQHNHDDSENCTLDCPVVKSMLAAPQPEDRTEDEPPNFPLHIDAQLRDEHAEAALREAQAKLADYRTHNEALETKLDAVEKYAQQMQTRAEKESARYVRASDVAADLRAALGVNEKDNNG